MSHNVFSEAMFDNNVISFLTAHGYFWTRDKHFMGQHGGKPCRCCNAHPKLGSIGYAPRQHLEQLCATWACELCLAAWTLSTVCRGARDQVHANARLQMYWYHPLAAKRKAESKGIGEGYQPQRGPGQSALLLCQGREPLPASWPGFDFEGLPRTIVNQFRDDLEEIFWQYAADDYEPQQPPVQRDDESQSPPPLVHQLPPLWFNYWKSIRLPPDGWDEPPYERWRDGPWQAYADRRRGWEYRDQTGPKTRHPAAWYAQRQNRHCSWQWRGYQPQEASQASWWHGSSSGYGGGNWWQSNGGGNWWQSNYSGWQ